MAVGKGMTLDIPTVLLAVYIVYAIFGIGMTGLLFSVAIGLILYGIVDSWAVLVAGIILSGLVWKVFLSNRFRLNEGFAAGSSTKTVPIYKQSASEISKRIQSIQRKEEPTGFLSSSFVEGFADAGAVGSGKPDAGSEKAKESFETAAGSSAPASTNAPSVTSELIKALPKDQPTAAVPPMVKESSASGQKTVQNFTNGGSQDGIFKLGSLPAETSGGFHIDAGTTLLNAMNSLKPDQIEAMTTDTKKLLETQKSLMGMLQSMKPMLNDGKQLMETFQEMFGNQKMGL